MRRTHFAALTALLTMLACSLPSQAPTATPPAPAETNTPAFTDTPASTLSPTITLTATITLTPTITATPTSTLPMATVNKQAHCRYGPSVAYLHAADLYAGDKGAVRWKGVYSNWLYVQFEKLSYSCWVAPSVVDVVGDTSALPKVEPDLQRVGSTMYGPPRNVRATRDGEYVTISWEQVKMTADDDRGYFIEAFICQETYYLWWTESIPDQYTTSFTIKDEPGCAAPSYGSIYTVEKHGYSLPEEIPWPKP